MGYGCQARSVYVDSGGDELKNRKPNQMSRKNSKFVELEGFGDLRDSDSLLALNLEFSGGHLQYCKAFQQAENGDRRVDTLGEISSLAIRVDKLF